MDLPPLTLGLWLFAVSPVALLLALVLAGVRTGRAAAMVTGWVVVVGVTVFRAPADLLLVGIAKGLWLGTWILGVIWPALLLYRLASGAGLERIGAVFSTVLPRRRENLLVVAWIFPSFIQGVAGFGTPIAVAAPLLLAMGWTRARAVLYPLVGYHWAVTFGSMGSSFYMASLTANLGIEDQARFAIVASSLLAVNCLVAGALVLLLDGGLTGLREGWSTLLLAGIPMAGTLVVTATAVPAVASLAAGTAGIMAVALKAAYHRRRAKRRVPSLTAAPGEDVPAAIAPPEREKQVPRLLSPYIYLLVTALPVFLWPTSREWVRGVGRMAPSFPGTETGMGWQNPPVVDFTPLSPFGHPGFYILLACVLGYLTYQFGGLWERGRTRAMLAGWARSLPQASISVLLLACVATLLVDAGIVSILARGIAEATGDVYPVIAPFVGVTGSFVTGSTTSSNALFAALQRDVALLIEVPPYLLVAAQTVGGNIGNALAPVVILIGATAVDAPEETGRILRATLLPAAVLFAATIAGILLLLG
ncbi:MAG: L-lactate permease [Nitriliruptor sp.]|uniref:L-lactate permease n=1 Tax=Nitriliruptor sp. TaxID=2448056 RepID=UPI00349FF869